MAPVLESHLTSAYSLVQWNGFCSLSSLVQEAMYVLDNQGTTACNQDRWALLRTIQREAHNQGYTDLSAILASLQMDPHFLTMPPLLIERARGALTSFQDVAYDILTDYLRNCAGLHAHPYEFEATCGLMIDQRASVLPNTQVQTKLRDTFILIIKQHWATLDSHPALHPIDSIVDVILHVLQPSPEYFDIEFAHAFVLYLGFRPISSEAVSVALGRCNPRFVGSLLTKSFSGAPDLTEVILLAILRLSLAAQLLAYFDEETLAAVSAAPRFICSSSVVAILKTRILGAATELPPDKLGALLGRLHLSNSCSNDPERVDTAELRKEALSVVLVEFLEQSTPVSTSDNWNKRWEPQTFGFLVNSLPCERLSQSLQRRFATWFLKTVNGSYSASHVHLIGAIFSWRNRVFLESLDDRLARQTLHAALTTYMSAAGDGIEISVEIIRRINETLTLLAYPDTGTEYHLPEITDIDTSASAIREDVSTQIFDTAESDHTPEVFLDRGESGSI
ncbi:hypothetical protein C8R44DRAFT_731131 [Mycena epipterygia]|nr:hypothetical protein C8R44DRAFT_731131 [Mycena epipterygia]